MNLSEYIKNRTRLKQLIHYLLVPRGQARPRRWVSWLVNPWVHQRGRGARICRSARMDVLPFQPFQLETYATIEDYCVVNNGVGPVRVGAHSRVGIGSVVIGPVDIGSQVIIAQHVVISGLNHSYQDVRLPIRQQPVTSQPVIIDDECWIGANVVITAGVRIGKHAVVAAGSVVTKNVPAYSVVAGNPARLLKHYDAPSQQWLRVAPDTIKQSAQPV